MRGTIRTGAVVMVGLVLLVACGPRGGGAEMIQEPPPDGWAEGVLEARADRDEDFRLAADSPLPADTLATFESLEYWAPDPAYRFVGTIQEYPPSEPIEMITTTGRVRQAMRHGWLTFRIDGTRLNLQIYRLLDTPETADPLEALFLPFTDATTGKETYPAGRYIDLQRDDQGRIVLDFNRAYNPLCAYGMPERYACPVTPAENRLSVRIEAGELGFLEH